MRRAKILFVAALVLVYLAVGPVAAVNVITDGQFNEELGAGQPWQKWASDCSNYGTLYGGSDTPTYTTVDLVKGRNTTNPALTWFRWDHDLIRPSSMAVGGKQTFGGSGLATAGQRIVLAADMTLMLQDEARPDWWAAFMGVGYTNGGPEMFQVKPLYIGSGPNPDQIPLDATRRIEWDLTSFFRDTAPGAKITSVFFGGQGNYFQGQADNVVLDISTVPEPGGILALAAAFTGATAFLRRRR